MEYLEKLIEEIKHKCGDRDYVYDSELREFRDRFYHYSLDQLKETPLGFFGWVSFSNDTTKKFNEVFEKLNIRILEEPVEPLHNHNLSERDMNRLSELEKKISSK